MLVWVESEIKLLMSLKSAIIKIRKLRFVFTYVNTFDNLRVSTLGGVPLADYRKRMFRGSKIEDCIFDFIEMEKTSNKQLSDNDNNQQLFAKGMNSAY
ncbi:hypothetical protein ABC345_09870 [Shouchella sp. 1P09AA]|uniref:hypothetical protein n=1 Tax=unclassified Shouchella TaxID=2893065 RepID=UPI0039A03FB8